jgi:hypothetical protein
MAETEADYQGLHPANDHDRYPGGDHGRHPGSNRDRYPSADRDENPGGGGDEYSGEVTDRQSRDRGRKSDFVRAEGHGDQHRATEPELNRHDHERERRWTDRDRRLGDRVDDWVRPRYGDHEEGGQPQGDYWTPVPADARYDDEPYGWPTPIDRLPAVPDYEPATGFDLIDVSGPTALVPQWPPLRPTNQVEQPRQWTGSDDGGQWTGPAEENARTGPGDTGPAEAGSWSGDAEKRPWTGPAEERPVEPARRTRSESTLLLPTLDEDEQRPRPRPRPSTVYRSKHAAE